MHVVELEAAAGHYLSDMEAGTVCASLTIAPVLFFAKLFEQK
jgi:membrane-associated phospholipid phosphatase